MPFKQILLNKTIFARATRNQLPVAIRSYQTTDIFKITIFQPKDTSLLHPSRWRRLPQCIIFICIQQMHVTIILHLHFTRTFLPSLQCSHIPLEVLCSFLWNCQSSTPLCPSHILRSYPVHTDSVQRIQLSSASLSHWNLISFTPCMSVKLVLMMLS